MKIPFINLRNISDPRGNLAVIEAFKDIPFEIKRVYYIYGTKGNQPRGFHAHKTLRQLAICLKGKCRVILNNGREKTEVMLDKPDMGLIIDKMVWHEMYFEDDSILLVLASDYYNEDDYIRNFNEFIECVNR